MKCDTLSFTSSNRFTGKERVIYSVFQKGGNMDRRIKHLLWGSANYFFFFLFFTGILSWFINLFGTLNIHLFLAFPELKLIHSPL